MNVLLMFGKVLLVLTVCCHVMYAAVNTDAMRFYFDNEGNYLVAANQSTCYMVKLRPNEVEHVHTNLGMSDYEVHMMRDWLGVLPEVRVYHGDSDLPTNIQHWCSKHDIYVLDRPKDTSTIATTRTTA